MNLILDKKKITLASCFVCQCVCKNGENIALRFVKSS